MQKPLKLQLPRILNVILPSISLMCLLGSRLQILQHTRDMSLVYRNTRIIATNRPPPPASDQGKQPLRSSGSGRATHRHNRTVARQHNRMQGRFMMSTQHNYAGIDIAKRNFVIAVSSLSKPKPKPTTRKVSPILSSTLKNTTSPSS